MRSDCLNPLHQHINVQHGGGYIASIYECWTWRWLERTTNEQMLGLAGVDIDNAEWPALCHLCAVCGWAHAHMFSELVVVHECATVLTTCSVSFTVMATEMLGRQWQPITVSLLLRQVVRATGGWGQ